MKHEVLLKHCQRTCFLSKTPASSTEETTRQSRCHFGDKAASNTEVEQRGW